MGVKSLKQLLGYMVVYAHVGNSDGQTTNAHAVYSFMPGVKIKVSVKYDRSYRTQTTASIKYWSPQQGMFVDLLHCEYTEIPVLKSAYDGLGQRAGMVPLNETTFYSIMTELAERGYNIVTASTVGSKS